MDQLILELQTQLLQLAADTAAKAAAYSVAKDVQNAKLDELLTAVDAKYRIK